MNKSIRHRGPDFDGHVCLSSYIALGHRRLSILDLDSRSNQPMRLKDGKYTLVYNGEIYNFKELRDELKTYYTFHTTSDSEVLLAGIEFKGIEWILQKAIGMYALAVYDESSKSLILAKDRFGIKPLYYTITENGIIFSSEIKGILASGLVQPEFDSEMIDDYLSVRYVREPNTFFKNINQVPSSHYIKIDCNGKIKTTRYWELPEMNFENRIDEEKIIEQTQEQIYDAFCRWFISDVPVGAYLSGGVDSSLTTAILSQYSGGNVNTYTIGFAEEGFNEFEYAKIVSEQYHTIHHEIHMRAEDYFSDWERLISFKDAPLAVPNEIPLAKMSEVLSKDVRVCISGEGADELFGGYGRIFRSAFDYSNLSAKEESFYKYFIKQYEYVPRSIRDICLDIDFSKRYKIDQICEEEFQKFRNEENVFRFFHQYHIQGLLQRVDMTSMQASIEARPPFLDHKLIEFVYKKVPYELKLHWNDVHSQTKARHLQAYQYSENLDTPKYILKKISEKYLSNEVIYRKKMGFPVPLTSWLPNMEQMVNEQLLNCFWLKTSSIESLLNNMKKEQRSGQILWMFLNVQLFYNKYFKKNWLW